MSQHLPVGPKATEHPLPAHAAYPEDPALSYRRSKVQACHRERQAIVYIRQSTPQQVIENRESADRQYSLVHRAVTRSQQTRARRW